MILSDNLLLKADDIGVDPDLGQHLTLMMHAFHELFGDEFSFVDSCPVEPQVILVLHLETFVELETQGSRGGGRVHRVDLF